MELGKEKVRRENEKKDDVSQHILVYTWYMGKRAPIYRAGKAVDLLCAGSTARLQPRSSIDDMSWTWTCNIRYTTCPKNLSHVQKNVLYVVWRHVLRQI
jgi:hypothetical protein